MSICCNKPSLISREMNLKAFVTMTKMKLKVKMKSMKLPIRLVSYIQFICMYVLVPFIQIQIS